jgi:hypothetical protein
MVAIVFSSCRKINEATELGGGVIPPIDGITTFDTTITVQAFNDTFGLANDSQYLSKSEEFFLGRINNDPFFGKTDARIFVELKPPSFPYAFANRPFPDSLTLDSVVLVLDYVETYGDTTIPQTINVYELDHSNNFRSDTAYLVRQNTLTYSTLLGSRSFAPSILNDSIKAYQDTTVNQMRIRLDNSFGNRLLGYDSIGNGAYKSDSLFRDKFKGFAIQSMSSGNAVMGFNLAGTNTYLAVYYKYEKRTSPNVPQPDTAVAYFLFNGNCAAANYVKRDYNGSALDAAINNPATTPDPLIYIQGSPGTFANIKIPALAGLSNRLIHRAELIVEQLYNVGYPSDSLLPPPEYLYLDAHDPTITNNYKYRTIPYDLTYTSSGSLNLPALGVVPLTGPDGLGNTVRTWKFNISRYVQHVLTGTQSLYDLRLSAPFSLNEQFGIPPGIDNTINVFVNPTIVKGRVRLIGNTGPLDPNPRRIRLRLIYSKL